MANSINAFLERLTAASGDYNKAKVGKLSYLDSVYLNIRPEVARMGQTIRIYYPDVAAFADQANNDWSPESLNPGFVDVPFGQRPGKAILVTDFEQFQTSTDIIDQFIDPNYKRAQEYANGAVAGLFTTANFNAYPALQSSKLGSVGIEDAANAWDVLVGNKVPISDPENASLLVHNNVHRNMLTDTNWYQESLVGAVIAASTRTDAAETNSSASVAFNFRRRYDQQAPTGQTANLTGTVTTTNGSVAVVGSSTLLAEVAVGSWVTFGTDTVSYRIATQTDATHYTLTQQYQGTGASGVTVKRTTYTGCAMHRYAVALAVRPLEIVNDGHIHSRLVMIKGLPMRIALSWQHIKSGWMLTLDYAMVAKVIRPDFGLIIQS